MKEEKWYKRGMCVGGRGGGDTVYCIGLVGALLYFWQHAPTLSEKLLAILKAFVWPAILSFKLLEFLNM